MNQNRKVWILVVIIFAISLFAFAQSELRKLTIVVNGHNGEIIVYRIGNQSFVDIETLAQLAQGSVSMQEGQLVLTLACPSTAVQASIQNADGMTKSFMTAALQDLTLIKDWHSTIAYALQRGVPGDGSRLVVFHDRATEGLRLATVEATNRSDQDALHLLTNHFNAVDHWKTKVVDARKSMNTANYSITPDAFSKDPEYQKIVSCSQFLSTMLASGKYEDMASCH